MNLGGLLNFLRKNILHDVSDQVAGASDYLWSDEDLVGFIDEAHRRFARQSLIIRDATTPECTRIVTVAGTDPSVPNVYQLHPSVIAVLSARFQGDSIDMKRAGHSQFTTYRTPDAYMFNPSSFGFLNPGKPLAYSTDEDVVANDRGEVGVVNLRLVPIPSSDYAGKTIYLRVIRTPIQTFNVSNLEAYPEVPRDYHISMLDYAAYLALRIDDKDEADPARAQDFFNKFEATCEQAKREVMRKLFTPAAWGFGQNGFTWVRDSDL